MNPKSLSPAAFVSHMLDAIHESRMSQTEYAQACGVHASHLSLVIHGRQPPCAKLLAAHQFKKVTYYEIAEEL